MISPKMTSSHSTGRTAMASIGRDSRLFGYEVDPVYYPYLPVKVPPNSPLHYVGFKVNAGV